MATGVQKSEHNYGLDYLVHLPEVPTLLRRTVMSSGGKYQDIES